MTLTTNSTKDDIKSVYEIIENKIANMPSGHSLDYYINTVSVLWSQIYDTLGGVPSTQDTVKPRAFAALADRVSTSMFW